MGLQKTVGIWLEQLWGVGWSEWNSAEAGQDVGTAWFWLSHAPGMKHGRCIFKVPSRLKREKWHCRGRARVLLIHCLLVVSVDPRS